MRNLRLNKQVKSYDAQVEAPSVEKCRKRIRQAIDRGQFHFITRRYREILKKFSDSDIVISQLAFILQRHGLKCSSCSVKEKKADRVKATGLYRRLLVKNPNHGPALLGLARPLKGERYLQAIQNIIKQTGDPAYNTHIGHYYREQGNFKAAEKYFQRALPAISDHYGIMYALHQLYKEMGEQGKAKRYARLALNRLKKMNDFYQNDPITKDFKKRLEEFLNTDF